MLLQGVIQPEHVWDELFSRVAGITNTLNGMLTNTLIVPSAVEKKGARKFNSVPSRIANTGKLSSVYGAFDPSSGGDLLNDEVKGSAS